MSIINKFEIEKKKVALVREREKKISAYFLSKIDN